MKYQIGERVLDVFKVKNQTSKKSSGDPNSQINYVKKRLPERSKEVEAITAICRETRVKNATRIFDLMAGSGFCSCAFLQNTKTEEDNLILNDYVADAVEILKYNFPRAKVLNEDVFDIKLDTSGAVLFFDFFNFTIKKLDYWKPILISKLCVDCSDLIITDSAVYGFKFGNLKTYGAKNEREYFEILSKIIYGFNGKKIEAVCIYGGASIVYLRSGFNGKIKFINRIPVTVRNFGNFGIII